jgi:hypothetical protein
MYINITNNFIKKIEFNELLFFENLNKLPIEIIKIIKEYIPLLYLVFLNKEYYFKYHNLFTESIKSKSEIYIRSMIRQDNDFVINKLFYELSIHWISMYDYYYKECIYINYLYFLLHYSIDNNSEKCFRLLNELIKKLGFKKNQHKKKTIRYIRWKI